MSNWALRGRSLYKLSLCNFCQANRFKIKNHILSSEFTSYFFSRNLFIINSHAIVAKCDKQVLLQNQQGSLISKMHYKKSSTSSKEQQQPDSEIQKLSKKDKLKLAIKDYGATVIIFHITISLMSLGLSYVIISSGIDVAGLMERVGYKASDVATGASTFVVAYAFHKMFAPVRISITLGATPFIVRYLRRIKILKPPKVSEP